MSNIIDTIQLSGVTYTIGGGGGKAIEAGRGISVTTGETADTVSFNLPISAGTGTNSLVIASDNYDLSNRATKKGAVALNGNNYHPTYATGTNSLAEGAGTKAVGYASHAEGFNTSAMADYSHAEGDSTMASGDSSHAEGVYTKAIGNYSHVEGSYTIANNYVEHASGKFNVSSSASTTFGDSGNTLFSVGNGTANNARHNAFEIRQNGDIYLTSGGTDIKLQDYLGGGGSSINVVQTTGSSTTDVMSQAAVTNIIGDIETLLSNI